MALTKTGNDNPRKPLLSKRRSIKTPLRNRTRGTLASSPSQMTLFGKQSIAWMWTLIHLQGGLRHDGRLSSYLLLIGATDSPDGPFVNWKQLSAVMQQGLVTRCMAEIFQRFERLSMPLSFPRKTPTMAWKVAYGSRKSLDDQASFHVETIDYEEMRRHDKPMMVLAITVCNLRNYYDQDKSQTIKLITSRYNQRYDVDWSEEDIALIWELVDGYTPSMWLYDERYYSWKRKSDIQREVKEILSRLTPGGRILVADMQRIVREWDEALEVKPRELGDAMRAITGAASGVSDGKSYYFGYQLPLIEDPPYDGEAPSSLRLSHAREALQSSGDNKPDYDPIALKKLDRAIRACLFKE